MSDQIQFKAINFSPMDLSINFIIGVILSAIIALHYHKRAQEKVLRNDLGYTLPVISMTTLLVIAVVKSSLALSLGLVGALSIVRFRTPIKEPEELAYIFLAIALGLCLGADQREAALIGVFVILLIISLCDLIGRSEDHSNSNLLLTIDAPTNKNEHVSVKAISEILEKCSNQINIRQIDKTSDHLSISCLATFKNFEDIDKLNDYLTKEYPGCLFSILDDSSFPNE
jgi:hypothetical protein